MSRRPNFTMEHQNKFIQDLIAEYGDTVTSKQILDFAESQGLAIPYFLLRNEKMKIGRGKYRLCKRVEILKAGTTSHSLAKALDDNDAKDAPALAQVAQVVNLASRRAMNVTESFVPDRNATYVPFGFFKDLKNIINSKVFYPIYITGDTGNGKTLMVEQVCAALNRECIRVNITKRTDETDLIGSYELIDGNTIRREGPVITAMRRGAILLLDETDYGTEDLLCLQPILEGKPYFDKKTGEIVHPAFGFNVVATANTKGKGSDDGRFIGANVLNEAFLERFAVTVEQDYPPLVTERKILKKNFEALGLDEDTFIEYLVTWADVIRKSYNDGAVDEVISTRRLVHITKAYSIFKDRMKAIELCLNRFDTDIKTSFLDLYTKVDATSVKEVVKEEVPKDFSTTAEELSTEYVTPIEIYFGEDAKTVAVSSHGHTTQVSLLAITTARNAEGLLRGIVETHRMRNAPGNSYYLTTETKYPVLSDR